MNRKQIALGLAALGLAAATAPATPAEQPAPAPPAEKSSPKRQIVRWPGGWMDLDAPGVIYRDDAPPPALGAAAARRGGSLTIVSNSGNGAGNRIGVDAGASGLTVLHNVRNGVGNRVTVTPAGPVVVAAPARAGAKGVKSPPVAWWEWLDDLP